MVPQESESAAAHRRRGRGRRRAGRGGTSATAATGSHRRPRTMAIEAWLLVGRRQLAMLAALVAVGLVLVSVPAQQKPVDLAAASAAQRRAAAAAANGGNAAPPAQSGRPAKQARDGGSPVDTRAAPVAPATPTPSPATPSPTTPNPAYPDPEIPDPEPSGAPAPGDQAPEPPPQNENGSAVPPNDEAPAPGPTTPVAGRRGTGPADSVRRTTTDTVALTFDDGPDPVQTPKLLDLLAKHQVTATFCLVGKRVQAHPDLVRRIAAEGHALCNHSWDHSYTLGKEPVDDIRADLQATDRAIRAAVPDAKIPYFRAPGGSFTDRLVTVADEFSMTSLFWEVDPRDWNQPDDETDSAHVERIVTEVRKHVRDGSIVLSHDFGQPGTIKAYTILLPGLSKDFTLGLP